MTIVRKLTASSLPQTFLQTAFGCALFGALAFGGSGCSKAKSPAEVVDPAFDKQWTSLAQNGLEALYIEDDRAEGLMGNVRRVAKPSAPPPLTGPAPAGSGALPSSPNGEDVHKIIRGNLAAVRTCYMSMARSGITRSGKAIVSFNVGPDGRPADVKVEAPSFKGTPLPTCVTNQVARWSFPKSQQGGGAVSYPFVFVGG